MPSKICCTPGRAQPIFQFQLGTPKHPQHHLSLSASCWAPSRIIFATATAFCRNYKHLKHRLPSSSVGFWAPSRILCLCGAFLSPVAGVDAVALLNSRGTRYARSTWYWRSEFASISISAARVESIRPLGGRVMGGYEACKGVEDVRRVNGNGAGYGSGKLRTPGVDLFAGDAPASLGVPAAEMRAGAGGAAWGQNAKAALSGRWRGTLTRRCPCPRTGTPMDTFIDNNAIEEVSPSRVRRVWLAVVWTLTFYLPSFMLSFVGGMKRPDRRTQTATNTGSRYRASLSSMRSRGRILRLIPSDGALTLVTDPSLQLANQNFTDTEPTEIGQLSAGQSADWYTATFQPKMKNYCKGPLVTRHARPRRSLRTPTSPSECGRCTLSCFGAVLMTGGARSGGNAKTGSTI
ncbi:hypothetical protein B0H11DRAFT_2221293 [Mycena galericulata]|nr:hypothetical protein B0H11DRAFT_2233755 [Mycena galericulata]KAJ7505109.1 hypothetical protein B0H11DRAFT_2221293 [Mycena galericulata]